MDYNVNGTIPSSQSTEKMGASLTAVYVTVPLVVLLVVCVVAILIFIYVRRKKRNQSLDNRNREKPGRVEISRVESKSEIKSEENYSCANVDRKPVREGPYYNSDSSNACTIVTENEYYNDGGRRLSGVVEDEYGYGQFVKKHSVTGTDNYSFVHDEHEAGKVFRKNIYVNTDEDKTKTTDNVRDANHNVYNSLGSTLVSRNTHNSRSQHSLYDHTVVTSCHMQADTTPTDIKPDLENNEAFTSDLEYVNVEMKDGKINQPAESADIKSEASNREEHKIHRCESSGEHAGENVPFYLELEDGDPRLSGNYCNCRFAAKMKAPDEVDKHKVHDVTEDEVDCDDDGYSENHEYFMLEKVPYEY